MANAPGRTRTCDPRLRRPSLYPAELRGLAIRVNPRIRRPARIRQPTRVMLAVLTTVLFSAGASSTAGARAARPPGRPARARAKKTCLVPGSARTIDQLWRPDLRRAINYARGRQGDIAFAVRTEGAFYGYRSNHVEWSASVVKAMLLVTYLDLPSVWRRGLDRADKSVLGPMIEASNNDAAQQVFDRVGQFRLRQLARRVGMTHFATSPVWGATRITARDQTRFFLHIDTYISARHRSYGMRLLRSIVPWERWGIGELVQSGWRLYFKGGWGYGTGLLDHQVALFIRGCARVSIAVLTMYDGSHAYGKRTLKGIFARLLSRFPTRFRRPRTRRRSPRGSTPTSGRALPGPADGLSPPGLPDAREAGARSSPPREAGA
jgi:hypothetical protein